MKLVSRKKKVKLHECPFCGGKAELSSQLCPTHKFRSSPYSEVSHVTKYFISCTNTECPCECSTIGFDSESEVIEVWNNRYDSGSKL